MFVLGQEKSAFITIVPFSRQVLNKLSELFCVVSIYSFDLGLVTTPTHLISMFALRGRVLTATHLSRVSIDERHFSVGNSRPSRLNLAPVVLVHLVHLGVVLEVRQEDVDLDNIVNAGAGLLQNSTEVADNLVL